MIVRESMSRHFLAGWLIVIVGLLAYFFIGLLLTKAVSLVVGVLFFVLISWFLIYKLRYRSVGNLELVRKMYADLKGAVERLKERLAKDEAPRRVATSRRRQALMNRERRKTDSSKEVPVDKRYTETIERRVREARARQDQSKGINDRES